MCIRDRRWRWQLGPFLISSGGIGLSEVKPRRLKNYADAEFDRCFALFATTFDVDAEGVSEEFQIEVLDLKCDKQKQKYTDMGVPDFYNFFQKKSIHN